LEGKDSVECFLGPPGRSQKLAGGVGWEVEAGGMQFIYFGEGMLELWVVCQNNLVKS
jgi:hypothetical protein